MNDDFFFVTYSDLSVIEKEIGKYGEAARKTFSRGLWNCMNKILRPAIESNLEQLQGMGVSDLWKSSGKHHRKGHSPYTTPIAQGLYTFISLDNYGKAQGWKNLGIATVLGNHKGVDDGTWRLRFFEQSRERSKNRGILPQNKFFSRAVDSSFEPIKEQIYNYLKRLKQTDA